MTEITIYDSQGVPVDDDNTEQNQQIEEFFFDGVKILVDTTDGYELTLFFRARDSEAGRAEQYYAVYQTDKSTGLFERFERSLQEQVEEVHGMILEMDADDAQLVPLLSSKPPLPDTDTKQNTISSMLIDGTQLTIGVETPKAALGLIRHYIASPADQIAVVNSIDDEMMIEYDFVIESGAYSGIEPVGDTEEAFGEYLRRTSANSARPRASNATSVSTRSYADQAKTIGVNVTAVAVGVVVMAGALVLLANLAAVAGSGIPETDAFVFV